jgi:hypothetical protein
MCSLVFFTGTAIQHLIYSPRIKNVMRRIKALGIEVSSDIENSNQFHEVFTEGSKN